jgi:hypothetical protein
MRQAPLSYDKPAKGLKLNAVIAPDLAVIRCLAG